MLGKYKRKGKAIKRERKKKVLRKKKRTRRKKRNTKKKKEAQRKKKKREEKKILQGWGRKTIASRRDEIFEKKKTLYSF